MVIGTALGLSNLRVIGLAIVLAFIFGYSLTLIPLRRAGLPWRTALPLAFAADTLSIGLMEIIDNAIMLLIPGAMAAPLDSLLFWASLALALLVAGIAAYPLNRWLIFAVAVTRCSTRTTAAIPPEVLGGWWPESGQRQGKRFWRTDRR